MHLNDSDSEKMWPGVVDVYWPGANCKEGYYTRVCTTTSNVEGSKTFTAVGTDDWLMLLMRIMIMEYNQLLLARRYRLQWGLREALTAAGIAQGLSPEVADTLTRQTLLGAAILLSDSGEDPAQLRINVTSPNGTTHAGLEVMYERGFAEVIDAVVAAASARSAELGS